ncbi:MAG TPA: hypothetical protein VJP60_05600 [Rhizomicrobium sp.]|nr:hypothetical protein [Rhizomicrobium sp.]
MRALAFVLLLLAAAMPASARLWKPTPQQQLIDYLSIAHNKPEESIVVVWTASLLVPSPVVKPLLDKYIVLSIAHTRRAPDGTTSWDDVQGVQLSDGAGHALTEVSSDRIPPILVGMIASADATMRQSSQGKSKVYWSVWEAGSVNACQRGKLVVNYGGESYSYDTPIPGCP